MSIDHTAWTLAEAAAARAGISPSAWLSAAARREAVRRYIPPSTPERPRTVAIMSSDGIALDL